MLPYILFEEYTNIFALEMASPGTSTVPIVSAHFRSLCAGVAATSDVVSGRRKLQGPLYGE